MMRLFAPYLLVLLALLACSKSTPTGLSEPVSGPALQVEGINRLTDHSDEDFSPSWSPDGRHLAFVSSRDGNREIYVMGLR